MSFNPDKTEIILFSNTDVRYNYNFTFNGNNILITMSHKQLGVTLSSVSRHLGIMRKLKYRLSRQNLEKLYLGTDHLIWRGGGGYGFFVSFRNFFSDNTRVKILFFCRARRKFFFQNSTLGYMTKTLNQIIFFFLHQNQNIFFSNIGNQNIFLEKNIPPPPPLQVKWSFP